MVQDIAIYCIIKYKSTKTQDITFKLDCKIWWHSSRSLNNINSFFSFHAPTVVEYTLSQHAQKKICPSGYMHIHFTPLTEIKGTVAEKLQQLHKFRDQHLQQSHDPAILHAASL